jgi:hypothetical protein
MRGYSDSEKVAIVAKIDKLRKAGYQSGAAVKRSGVSHASYHLWKKQIASGMIKVEGGLPVWTPKAGPDPSTRPASVKPEPNILDIQAVRNRIAELEEELRDVRAENRVLRDIVAERAISERMGGGR